jgi:hypothetical protein
LQTGLRERVPFASTASFLQLEACVSSISAERNQAERDQAERTTIAEVHMQEQADAYAQAHAQTQAHAQAQIIPLIHPAYALVVGHPDCVPPGRPVAPPAIIPPRDG